MIDSGSACPALVPLPVVRLNRIAILAGVLLGFALRAPLLTTLLFLIVAPAAAFGRRASIIYAIGSRLFPKFDPAHGEDPQLMRFNNALAAIVLGCAQVAFALRVPAIGWIFAGLAACAAAVALAGFCFGCFLFYQFKLNRSRLFGSNE